MLTNPGILQSTVYFQTIVVAVKIFGIVHFKNSRWTIYLHQVIYIYKWNDPHPTNEVVRRRLGVLCFSKNCSTFQGLKSEPSNRERVINATAAHPGGPFCINNNFESVLYGNSFGGSLKPMVAKLILITAPCNTRAEQGYLLSEVIIEVKQYDHLVRVAFSDDPIFIYPSF